MAKAVKKERFSVGASLAVAIVAFPPVCAVAAVFVREIVIAIGDRITWTGVQFGDFSEAMFLSAMVAPPVLLAYFASRLVYASLRWQTIENQEGRYCVQCGYDLTGNTSGRCPECGANIGGSISAP